MAISEQSTSRNTNQARRSGTGTGFDAYRDIYREHYQTTFGDADTGFTTYEPAYRYGYTYGTDPDYRDRDYTELEPELRRRYEEEHGKGTFAEVRDAIRHAFNHARSEVRGSTAATTGTMGTGAAAASTDFGAHEDAFRSHHRETYGDRGEYRTYQPAYRYGYRHGSQEEFRERAYEDAEPELRSRYEREHGEGTFGKVRDAVRHGYHRARSGTSERTSAGTAASRGESKDFGSSHTASGNPGSVMRGDLKGEPAFDDHRDAYRRHHREAFEGDFSTYEPAYRYGHRYGTDKEYRGKKYAEVEPELRRSYEREHGEGTYANVRGAARHAFDYVQGARSGSPTQPTSRRR